MGVLGDIIVGALQQLLSILFTPIENIIQKHGPTLLQTIVGTPHPNSIFARPTNGAWPNLYDYHWDTIIPLSLLMWAGVIGLIIFLETTSNLFGSYHRSKLKKRAFTGLLGILSWWWVMALTMRFMEALTGVLIPDLSNVSLFETLSFSTMGVLGLVIALFTDFTLFVLIAVIYLMRQVILYLFVLLMPILIVLWIPGVGPFSLMSAFMKRLAGFFVPFLFMTVPVALLIRLGEILGSSADLSFGGIGAWLSGLVIPLIAVISPFVLFWQAGALFFMADRASNHMSARTAQRRAASTLATQEAATHGGQNFVRGARGQPAVRPDGQAVLASGNSRAHAAGSRLHASGRALGNRLRGNGANDGGGGGGEGSSTSLATDRNEDFESLRDHSTGTTQDESSERYDVDDRPYYLN